MPHCRLCCVFSFFCHYGNGDVAEAESMRKEEEEEPVMFCLVVTPRGMRIKRRAACLTQGKNAARGKNIAWRAA